MITMSVQVINNTFAVTFYFKEIFGSYDDFKLFLSEFTNIDPEDSLNVTLFGYLFNKYCNSNVNYDTIDAFKRNFAIVYENIFAQYKFRVDKINKVYELSDEDLNVISYGINNVALNDNSAIENALDDVVDFVTSQTSNKQKANKFMSYLNALKDVNDRYIVDYLDKFRKLFIAIIPSKIYVYTDLKEEK